MAIFTLNLGYTGTQGIGSRRCQLVCDDSLDAVETPGYIPSGYNVLPTDIFDTWYGENSASYAVFVTSRTIDGTITLSTNIAPGNVNLPVVSGHFATFQGTAGAIGDNGFVPSNSSLTQVTMGVTGTYTPGNILVANDASGSSRAGIGIAATQINAPITATPSNIPLQMGLNLTAPSITSGYAYGSNSFVSFAANAGGDLAGSSSTITGTGALGATSVTSGHESILNVSGTTMTSGAVLAAFNAVFNAGLAVTGSTDQYALISSKGPAAGSLGCLINYQGRVGNLLNTTASSPMVGSPGGLTPSGLFASLFIEIGGVQYQIPCSTILS